MTFRVIDAQISMAQTGQDLQLTARDGVVPDTYTMLLSAQDLSAVGEQFGAIASEKLKSIGKTLVLSAKTAPISGGFILICGDVELRCTLSGYVEQIRSRIEGEVCQILFA